MPASPTRLCAVTGASRGIGKAIALRFLQEGFAVFAVGKNPDNLKAFAQEVPGTVHTHLADLSDPNQAAQAAQALLKLTDNYSLQVIVNNAGRFAPDSVLDHENHLPDQINTNLYSAYYFTKPLLPYLTAQRSGHVFTVCSIASRQAYPGGASYSVSKYALLGLAHVLRAELAPYGVRATALLPGATLTDSWKGTTLPPDQFISANDIAELVWSTFTLSQGAVVEELLIRPQQGDH